MLLHQDYSDVCLMMVVGSWVLERTPRDKCHLTTSHQRITPSTRPHAAEADCGSGWQRLVRSPCCQFLCFFFLSQCIYFWIHQIITVYILSILYFYLLTVPQESQTKVNITDLSFFFLSCVPHCTLEPSHSQQHRLSWEQRTHMNHLELLCTAGVSILPIYSFIIYSGPLSWQNREHVCIR